MPYKSSGTVEDQGSGVERRVAIFRKDTLAKLVETLSDAGTGEFEATHSYGGECIAVCEGDEPNGQRWRVHGPYQPIFVEPPVTWDTAWSVPEVSYAESDLFADMAVGSYVANVRPNRLYQGTGRFYIEIEIVRIHNAFTGYVDIVEASGMTNNTQVIGVVDAGRLGDYGAVEGDIIGLSYDEATGEAELFVNGGLVGSTSPGTDVYPAASCNPYGSPGAEFRLIPDPADMFYWPGSGYEAY